MKLTGSEIKIFLLNLSCSLLVLEDFPAGTRFKLIFRLLRKVLCNHKSSDDRTLFSRSCLIIGLAHFQLTRDAVLTIASRELKLFKIFLLCFEMQQISRGAEKLVISLTSNKVILAYAFFLLILWSNTASCYHLEFLFCMTKLPSPSPEFTYESWFIVF